jgi:hypothetical protein
LRCQGKPETPGSAPVFNDISGISQRLCSNISSQITRRRLNPPRPVRCLVNLRESPKDSQEEWALAIDDQPSAFEILARRNGSRVDDWNWQGAEVERKRSSTRVIAIALLIFLVLIEIYFGL